MDDLTAVGIGEAFMLAFICFGCFYFSIEACVKGLHGRKQDHSE